MDVQTFWPLTRQPPSTFSARVRRPARSEPAPGSLKSWHQTRSPRRLGGTKRSSCSGLPCSMRVGTTQLPITMSCGLSPAAPQLLGDDELGHRVGGPAPRRREVRGREAVLGEVARAPGLVEAGCLLQLGAHLGTDLLGLGREVERELAPHAGQGQLGDPLLPGRGRPEQQPQALRPAEVEAGVVLPREADAAEGVDAVLGRAEGRLDADRTRHRGRQ